jgi:hypothetical protein
MDRVFAGHTKSSRQEIHRADRAQQYDEKFRDEDLSSLTFEGFVVAKTLAKAIQLSKSGKDGLQSIANQKSTMDLGGILLTPHEGSYRMSSYVDIALFRKGGGLMF